MYVDRYEQLMSWTTRSSKIIVALMLGLVPRQLDSSLRRVYSISVAFLVLLCISKMLRSYWEVWWWRNAGNMVIVSNCIFEQIFSFVEADW